MCKVNIGGGMLLSATVMMKYCIGVRDDRYALVAAVLLRSAQPWPLHAEAPQRPRLPRLPPLAPGAGGQAGRHDIFVDSRDRLLWINRSLRLPLGEFNVVMLDRADDPVDLPVVDQMCTIDWDLGAAPLDPFEMSLAARYPAQQLKRLLQELAPVRQFLHL